jgi:hypothetical protein
MQKSDCEQNKKLLIQQGNLNQSVTFLIGSNLPSHFHETRRLQQINIDKVERIAEPVDPILPKWITAYVRVAHLHLMIQKTTDPESMVISDEDDS